MPVFVKLSPLLFLLPSLAIACGESSADPLKYAVWLSIALVALCAFFLPLAGLLSNDRFRNGRTRWVFSGAVFIAISSVFVLFQQPSPWLIAMAVSALGCALFTPSAYYLYRGLELKWRGKNV